MGDADTFDLDDTNTEDNSTISVQQYTSCDGDSEVLFYTVNGGGHSWPGSFPVPGLLPLNEDIEAHFDIWEFFSRHVHPDPAPGEILEGVNVKELEAINYGAVYPNPFDQSLEITINDNKVNAVQLIDIHGRVILENQKVEQSLLMDTKDIAHGIYFVRLMSANQAQVIKVVKR